MQIPSAYSFNDPPLLHLIRQIDELFPGIEQAVSIYYDSKKGKTDSVLYVKDKGFGRVENISEVMLEIRHLRSKAQKHEWLSPKDLPFKLDVKPNGQITIHDEEKNTLLLLRFYNPEDNKYDLLYLFLRNNTSNFGLTNSNKLLTTEHKSIICSIVSKLLSNKIAELHNDKMLHRGIQTTITSLIHQINGSKEESKKIKYQFEASLVDLSQYHLKELSEKYGYTYEFAESARKRIKQYKGDVNHLKTIIENAIVFINNQMSIQPDDTILIDDWALDFSFSSKAINAQLQTGLISNEKKDIAEKYLNTWEDAACRLKMDDIRITSENVGKHCPKEITAPAISSAIKKHGKTIIKLLADNPQKWKTIRAGFRPIIKLLEKNNKPA